jgi:hypothetical protein
MVDNSKPVSEFANATSLVGSGNEYYMIIQNGLNKKIETNIVHNLDNLFDVDVSGATDGNILIYSGSTWTTGETNSVSSLNDLSDVQTPSPTEGDVLIYSGGTWTTGETIDISNTTVDVINISEKINFSQYNNSSPTNGDLWWSNSGGLKFHSGGTTYDIT